MSGVVIVPKQNVCQFRKHRFGTGAYAELRRDAAGRRSRTKRTTFLIEHCTSASCCAQRLVK